MDEGILYRCPVCNMPMFKKLGPKIFIMQYYDGKPVKTEMERDIKAPYSQLKIRCGACKKGAHILSDINEVIEIKESFSSET